MQPTSKKTNSLSWLWSTHHKDIALRNLLFVAIMAAFSCFLLIYLRIEKMNPGVQYFCQEGFRIAASPSKTCTPDGKLFALSTQFFESLWVYFFLLPAILGWLGIRLVPAALGAKNISFPRTNTVVQWLFFAGTAIWIYVSANRLQIPFSDPNTIWVKIAPISMAGTPVNLDYPAIFSIYTMTAMLVISAFSLLTTGLRTKLTTNNSKMSWVIAPMIMIVAAFSLFGTGYLVTATDCYRPTAISQPKLLPTSSFSDCFHPLHLGAPIKRFFD